MKDCIGGVILYDETINQMGSSGKSIPELISLVECPRNKKVDTGAKNLANLQRKKLQKG